MTQENKYFQFSGTSVLSTEDWEIRIEGFKLWGFQRSEAWRNQSDGGGIMSCEA